jgi:hypothetical protein
MIWVEKGAAVVQSAAVVWPITGLYLPIVGWWLYDNMARPKPMCCCVISGKQLF